MRITSKKQSLEELELSRALDLHANGDMLNALTERNLMAPGLVAVEVS